MPVGGFNALCYHYIRPANAPYPRLLGATLDEFQDHVRYFSKRFRIIAPQEVSAELQTEAQDKAPALLFSFDDGLSDHLKAAEILAQAGHKAVFFLPSCIFQDGEPANPVIIHYVLSGYPIRRFLEAYHEGLEEAGADPKQFEILHRPGVDEPWTTIGKIKDAFKYRIPAAVGRSVLLSIYRRTLLRDRPDALEIMHLRAEDVRNIVSMGHALGAHSRTHVSIAGSQMDESTLRAELLEPKEFLERTFKAPVDLLSYPFGEPADCLPGPALQALGAAYRSAFTVSEKVNRPGCDPLSLGRVCAMKGDSAESLAARLPAA